MDKRLNAFLAVARQKTTTAAAAKINLAQSSVTKRIASLETELGTSLFLRDRRGMTLTEAGEMLLERAIRIEHEYRDGMEEISTIAAAGMHELRVGAGPVFHMNWVAGLFATLRTRFPDLRLDLKTQNQEDMGEMLKAAELDVYLGILRPDELDDTIFVKHVTQVEHGIVMRADDPNSRGTSINPASLSGYGWVSFVVDPVMEQNIEQYTVPQGTQKSLIDIRTTSLATGIQLVQTGRFVMSAPLQLNEVVRRDGLVIRPIVNGMPPRDAGIHVRKSSLGHGAIKATISYFDEISSSLS